MARRKLRWAAALALVVVLTGSAAAWHVLPGHLRVDLAGRVARIADSGDLMGEARERIDARYEAVGVERGAPVIIRVFKEEAELELWAKRSDAETYAKVHTFPICYFSGPLGPKLKEGDGMSPEGFYAVGAKQMLPTSRYHRAFNIAFPNAYDRAKGRTGSYLMVHGGCVSIGCYAMTDAGVSEIYLAVEDALDGPRASVPVHLFPFRMEEERMELAEEDDPRWLPFWRNLQKGYAAFEATKIPPQVGLANGRYVFDDPAATPIRGW